MSSLLRASVAALMRVVFEHPQDGRTMLALERIATVRAAGFGDASESPPAGLGSETVVVRVKPFGGGVRILDPQALDSLLGGFEYDSERSRQESDARVLIRPDSWQKLKDVCARHLERDVEPHLPQHVEPQPEAIFDISPDRELDEEFRDALGTTITADQYSARPIGLVIEDSPNPTESVRAPGVPTVRIYYLFEVRLTSSDLIETILMENGRRSDSDLTRMAQEDALSGGRGRANTILALDLDELAEQITTIDPQTIGQKLRVGEHEFETNVLAILPEVRDLRYRL